MSVRVESLEISKFRRFANTEISIGSNLTIIAGQNGTSKSTLLGMLAQPFSFGVVRGRTAKTPDKSSYLTNYHGMKLHDFKDLTGKNFMYDCKDIFRLSKSFDYGKDYEYSIKLRLPSNATLPNDKLVVNSSTRDLGTPKARMRFVTGPGKSHQSGEGNFPHPVIFLGLSRLWPLAASKSCTFVPDNLTKDEREWYVENYNTILCLDEFDNDTRLMDTAEKSTFLTPLGTDYDGESCS